MKRTFAQSFKEKAEEIQVFQQAYNTLPDTMPYEINKCFLHAYELKAHEITKELKDQIDERY